MILEEETLIHRAQEVVRRESQAVQELAGQLNAGLLPVVETLLNCPGHVLVTGAGTSRAVAERFAHLLACCGTPALFIPAADALHGGAGAIKAGDVVYIISKGGQSLEINQFAQIAHQRGARIIAHTEQPASPLGQMADQVFHVVAPADVDPYGMIATGSSLVNSAACDALCVLLLEQRGYSREAFGQTHPGGAVGRRLRAGTEHPGEKMAES
jgi:D-arabinose 5-phosphate isomerase GutQ